MKRLIQEFFIFTIIPLVNFACATTNQLPHQKSPTDSTSSIEYNRNQFIKCKKNAIPKYLNKSNDLDLVKKAVMADCGSYLSKLVFSVGYPAERATIRRHWEKIVENEVGKSYLLKQERDELQKGAIAFNQKDYQTALSRLRPLANNGNAIAQKGLGDMYSQGFGVEQSDKEAIKWYRLSAEQGVAKAQANLGMMYAVGLGVKQSDKEAVKWYRLSAEKGDAFGQWGLGFMYSTGREITQNHAEAVKLYKLSAEQGETLSYVSLGMVYANGDGVLPDIVEAYKWYEIAESKGSEIVHKGKIRIERKMTPAQISEAQKLAREWKKEHEK